MFNPTPHQRGMRGSEMTTSYRTELYNLIANGQAVGNGYLVALIRNGSRAHTVAQFGADKDAAYAYCAQLNAAA